MGMPVLLCVSGWRLRRRSDGRLLRCSPSAHYSVTRRLKAGGWLVAVLASGGALTRLRRVEVVGESMRPTLEPGDRLLLARTRRARPGDLVAVRDPRSDRRTVVKRVAAVSASGLSVLGDNPAASTDSRVFGTVPSDALQGRVLYRYFPARRRGRPGRAGTRW